MPPVAASNIRVFVRFKEPTIFAGEDIECIITFKNVGSPPDADEEDEPQTPLANGFPRGRGGSSVAPSRQVSNATKRPPLSRAPSVASVRGLAQIKGHRPTLSLNAVSASTRGGLRSAPLPARPPNSAVRPSPGHGRSLSIMSLGSDAPSEGRIPKGAASVMNRRPARGHTRSASLQVTSRKPAGQISPLVGSQSSRQPSPLYEATTPPAMPEPASASTRPPRKRSGTTTAPNAPAAGRQNGFRTSPGPSAQAPNFQFPPPPSHMNSVTVPSPPPNPSRSPSSMHSAQFRSHSPRPPEGWSGTLGNLNPISRVMSASSTAGTPRSSGEFYSMSNHSDETLASELPYQNNQSGRFLPRPPPRPRQASYQQPAKPETVMMAYVHTHGSFTLDGSLVNAAPFEEVKRRGVQGGGGVVGVERSTRSSGYFGAFSWGNIGESLGGLLGGDEMSSIAQMKASAGSKSVPLLSTPQSLLGVNVTLAPGESQSYSYRFSLPRGLPPSHKGRAIKVEYHLAIGVQRPSGQNMKAVEMPFRVLGSVNARGESLGHDLMAPYVLLQDTARTQLVAPKPSSLSSPFPAKEATNNKMKTHKQGLEDFLRYTERLLEGPTDGNGALLSPTSPTSSSFTPNPSRQQSLADSAPASQKEAIDLAILRSNHSSRAGNQKEGQSANHFNIARSGQLVAVLTLLRPAYRLGEAVLGTLDFTSSSDTPQLPTYSVLAELETAEGVDASLALRSSSSIQRVTRKVHAVTRESTLFARCISLNLAIPPSATPTFETTGVSLQWKVRIEFTVARQQQGLGLEDPEPDDDLFEELGRDERGVTLIAKERLLAETFEIAVPIRVFGACGIEGLNAEPEGLIV